MTNAVNLVQRPGADARLLADILRVRPQAARIALHTEKIVQMRGGFLEKEDVFNLARQIDAACDGVVVALAVPTTCPTTFGCANSTSSRKGMRDG
jgi:hypothetical protein